MYIPSVSYMNIIRPFSGRFFFISVLETKDIVRDHYDFVM
jgi:hypothetical protein